MANKLAYYLRRSAGRDPIVSKAQVAELIGEKLADELCLYDVKKSEIRVGRVGRRSAIAASKKVNSVGLAQYNRIELLEAIEAAQGKNFQCDGTEDEISLLNQIPNPSLVKDEDLRAKLIAKGYTEFEDTDLDSDD